MVAELEIRKRLARFLANELSLDDFEDWLVQGSWNAHREGEGPAQQLAYAIELRLAEHSSGHLSLQELRDELAPFVKQYRSLPRRMADIHEMAEASEREAEG